MCCASGGRAGRVDWAGPTWADAGCHGLAGVSPRVWLGLTGLTRGWARLCWVGAWLGGAVLGLASFIQKILFAFTSTTGSSPKTPGGQRVNPQPSRSEDRVTKYRRPE